MGLSTLTLFLIACIGIWLVILTWYVLRFKARYAALLKKTEKKDIVDFLIQFDEEIKVDKQAIETLSKRILVLEEKNKNHIQRIGFVRFNPFANTGGEQSFSIALLDEQDNGMVITALHGRNGSRWYAKIVKRAKGLHVALSEEELEAIKQAHTGQ